jgi:hypothetical protein
MEVAGAHSSRKADIRGAIRGEPLTSRKQHRYSDSCLRHVLVARFWLELIQPPIIDLCIKNAIIDIEVQNSYAQTKRECRSSGRPAQTSFGVAG